MEWSFVSSSYNSLYICVITCVLVFGYTIQPNIIEEGCVSFRPLHY